MLIKATFADNSSTILDAQIVGAENYGAITNPSKISGESKHRLMGILFTNGF